MGVSPIKNTTFRTMVRIAMLIATSQRVATASRLRCDIRAEIGVKSGWFIATPESRRSSRRRDYVATISQYIGSRHRTIRDVDRDVCCNIAKRRDKFDVATNVAICRDFKQINIIII